MIYQIFPVVNTPFSIACIYSTFPPSYLMYKMGTLNIEDINRILEKWTSKSGNKLYLDNFQVDCFSNTSFQLSFPPPQSYYDLICRN